jgi:hypothetical protein
MSESTERDNTAAPAPDETAAALAYRALLDHATRCARCVMNWRTCPTRRALTETLREVRP